MKQLGLLRAFALLLLVTLVLPATSVEAREQGAVLAAEGTTSMVVDGERIAASRQREDVVVAGAAFAPGELVGLWLTFADGSVFGVDREDIAAAADGTFAVRVTLDASLPVGRHTFSARGKSSGLGAAVAFMLLPGSGPSPTSGARLLVEPATVRQLETVVLNAHGFGANEAVSFWLTLPNGSVIGLGQVTADRTGTVAEPLTMPGWLPVGRYAVTARGHTSGATAIAEARLDYGNGLDVDGARLAANLGRAVQRTVLEIAASGFTPNESVSFWQTLPDGAVVALGDLQADDDGNLRARLDLSEALPTGTHYLSFRSNTSNQAGFARIILEPGPVAPAE
jgi:hypothetical protein